MIRLSDKFSIQYKNGYYITHEHAKRGVEAKNAGEEYTCNTQTYPTVLSVWEALKAQGQDGNAVMITCDNLLKQNNRDVYSAYLKAKEAKAKKESLK